MRRKYFGLAMAAVATLGPAQVYGGDKEIAQSIMERLKLSRDTGDLKDFSLDMKVDEGVVLFRGKVIGDEQRQLVLDASEGIAGIRDVVDELEVTALEVASSKPAKIYKTNAAIKTAAPAPEVASAKQDQSDFSFAQALAEPGQKVGLAKQEVMPGIVRPTAAYEGAELNSPVPASEVMAEQVGEGSGANDEQITQAVVRAIGRAQAEGYVKNFGVDVNVSNGMIDLEGHAASQEQREFLEKVAEHAPGARGVLNRIEVTASGNAAGGTTPAMTATHRTNSPQMTASSGGLQPLPPANAMQPQPMHAQMQRQQQMQMQAMHAQMQQRGVPAQQASYGSYGSPQVINGERVVPGSIVNHGPTGDTYPGAAGGQYASGAPMMGQPVPMAPAAPAGAPRYDSPNLPNYAWPGYAANGNYAAVSYPQQYSPSAFPFIGPFYPYPQVPLGWRKVSLEWDDGWWFLDFTDK
ncbi:BON domain-containing protein [Allorhodopirellula heiligendammensis]|uniref:BON domain protein n=1 Tax=Allorhodopirellula heiligendammensis TaxID=2714739 RepID=A0A5C6C3A6_9BACT|nr:BON domain-containing protein [Allorhodopirellula heiligendammensis]TWU18101.1 BON domain protein [Allorhodopirellula heiligendammensis]